MPEDARRSGIQRHVAGFGLPGGVGDQDLRSFNEVEWRVLLGMVARQRLSGLAMAAAEAGQLDLADWQFQGLLELQRDAMIRALELERTLFSLAGTFEGAGLDMVVLKGPALAHTLYPNAAWRPFGDLDLLVRTEDWDEACGLLSGSGFHRRYTEPRPGFSKRFGHTAQHVRDDGLEVDLHRTLVSGPFGLWIEPRVLFEHTDTFRLGGKAFRRLDDSALFLHACVHASLGHRPPLLLPLRDVVQTVIAGKVDMSTIADLSTRWRLGAVVQHACTTAWETLGVRVSMGSLIEPSRRSDRRERRALEAYTTERRSRGGRMLASVRAIPGLRSKLFFISALVFPSREFVDDRARGTGRASYLKRWLTPLNWLQAAVFKAKEQRQ